MCPWVRTQRRTGISSACTASANGAHCERTIKVSITVRPSSSTTTPAFATPVSPPGSNQTNTPSASSCSVSVGRSCATRGTVARDAWTRNERTTVSRMSERTRNLPRRTCHATPGSNEKMLGKAPGLGADQVFLDLEDSVAPLEKEAAREKVVRAINEQDWGDAVLCVRVNAWDTEWTYQDVVHLVEGCGPRLDELMLPKCQSAAEVVALDLLLTQVEKATGRAEPLGLEVQIETARGLIAVEEICAASP